MSQLLVNQSEELYRQIHPIMLGEDGEPSRTAFTPTKRDEGRLSTLREHVGAEAAYRRHVEENNLQSTGTYACSVEEVSAANCHAIDDADEISVPDHASIDFTSIDGRRARDRAARQLRDYAVARGCKYRPAR